MLIYLFLEKNSWENFDGKERKRDFKVQKLWCSEKKKIKRTFASIFNNFFFLKFFLEKSYEKHNLTNYLILVSVARKRIFSFFKIFFRG